jgi:hypothetical protein
MQVQTVPEPVFVLEPKARDGCLGMCLGREGGPGGAITQRKVVRPERALCPTLLLQGLALVQGEPMVMMGLSKSSSVHPVARRLALA